MITDHQPTIFGNHLIAAVSSRLDGNQKFGLGEVEETLDARELFLKKIGISIRHTSLVKLDLSGADYTRYRIVKEEDKSLGMLSPHDRAIVADALIVRQPGHALFLPLADCAGVVLYDPRHAALMVSHIGRHSIEQQGVVKSVEYLTRHCKSSPEELLVWVSPSVGKATYPLRAFDGKGLREVITEQLQEAGVKKEHIELSDVDTAADLDYFSHSEFLKGNRDENGRFAIVAMMTGQGEPAP